MTFDFEWTSEIDKVNQHLIVISSNTFTALTEKKTTTIVTEEEEKKNAMGREVEELQFIGFFGIFVEAYYLIASRGKLFSKIALSLILPVFVFALANDQFIAGTVRKIEALALQYPYPMNLMEEIVATKFSSVMAPFLLGEAVFIVVNHVFSLLSISAVAYTVACAYTAKGASFRKVMKVLPKVFKRLMATYLCGVAILFFYDFTLFLLFLFLVVNGRENFIAALLGLITILFYFFVLIYIIIVWNLAFVVSVLEDIDGISAFQKSWNLLKGKKWTVVAIFVVQRILFAGVRWVTGKRLNVGLGVGLVISVANLVTKILWNLVDLVVQSVVYFFCKSYHHENIDVSLIEKEWVD